MTNKTKALVSAAYENGFMDGFGISAEGFNQEYPFDQNGTEPITHEQYVKKFAFKRNAFMRYAQGISGTK